MSEIKRLRGAKARVTGHRAEWIAAAWLMLKGYRILGFRLRSPQGEIDLLALKGQVLAVVEVKRRMALDVALDCVTPAQRQRLLRAARAIAARRRGLAHMTIRLDLFALAPGRWPRHILAAWNDDEVGA